MGQIVNVLTVFWKDEPFFKGSIGVILAFVFPSLEQMYWVLQFLGAMGGVVLTVLSAYKQWLIIKKTKKDGEL